MFKTFFSVLIGVVTLTVAAFAQSDVSSDVFKDLVPSGKLRAAINGGNVVLVQKDAAGAVTGITVDLARELAHRLGVSADLVEYEAAGKVTDAFDYVEPCSRSALRSLKRAEG